MARKRMIDPGIWQSEDFSKLSTLAKLVFVGLFSNADDEGRGRAKAAYIKSILFPYDEGMRVTDVDRALSEIASHMSITFYAHRGNEYYSLEHWEKWQRIDRPSPSSLPGASQDTRPLRGTLAEPSPSDSRALAPNRKEEKESKYKQSGGAKRAGAEMDALLSAYTQNPAVSEALRAYMDMRRAKHKPATERAMQSVLKELDVLCKGQDALRIAVLEQSTRNSWTDVYPVKGKQESPAGQPQQTRHIREQQYAQRTYAPEKYTGPSENLLKEAMQQ